MRVNREGTLVQRKRFSVQGLGTINRRQGKGKIKTRDKWAKEQRDKRKEDNEKRTEENRSRNRV